MARNIIDKSLAIGAGFDWITPTVSLAMNLFGNHRGYSTPAEYMSLVEEAARYCGIKLHNVTLSPDGNLFLFDAEPEEWGELQHYLGWEA